MQLPPDRLDALCHLLIDVAFPQLRRDGTLPPVGGLTPRLPALLSNLERDLRPLLDLAA
jgi:hypothetical protein